MNLRGLAGGTVPVLAALLLGGCAREPLLLPPTVSLSEGERLSEGHIFSGVSGLAAQPLSARPVGFPDMPAPVALASQEFLVGVTPLDLSRIQAGLRGRSEASLEIFAANVRQQEEELLKMSLRLLQSEEEPGLEMELAELEDRFFRTVSELRSGVADEKRQLLLQIGVLQSQNRVMSTLHGTPDDTELKAKQAELEALENRLERLLRQERLQTDREKQALRNEYRSRQEAEVARQKLLAEAESTRRVELRERESRQAVGRFLDAVTGLRRVSAAADGLAVRLDAPVAFGSSFGRSGEFIPVYRQVSRSARKDVTLALRLASVLTPETDGPGLAEERLQGLLQPMPGH